MTARPTSTTAAAEYDYVVVGGGTAGGIVAARLSENPGVTVGLLLAEEERHGRDPALRVRRGLGVLAEGEEGLDRERGGGGVRLGRIEAPAGVGGLRAAQIGEG